MQANPETALMHRIALAVSRLGARVFRNNVGFDPERKIRYGLCKGSSDLIGWTPVTITRAHVGKTIAVFTAIEAKGVNTRTTKEQAAFIKKLIEDGGIAIIARDEQAAVEGIVHGPTRLSGAVGECQKIR